MTFIISFLPFYLVLAIITYVSSRGPALYKQERIGRDGRSFTMYKFRSMEAEAEGETPLLAVPNDPRITRWGRFMRRYKLDETPQFFNVLGGSMSIVGPRPERAYFRDKLTLSDARLEDLNTVKPGITSLGQIKFGYASNLKQMQRRARFDLLYLRNLSLGTDMKIIALTVLHVIRGEGSLSTVEK
jgi:lipopolysaccharide/colanic/teichoic acid biosynthesis glycosyltransferase